MRPLPLVCGLLTAAAVGAGGLAPAANAAAAVDLHARLHHSTAFPNATGHSDYTRSPAAGRQVEVTVRHIVRLADKRVTVYVNRQKVGTMLVNSGGVAERHWSTSRGQAVPFAAAGDPVRVRSANGTLVASGRYRTHL